MVDRVLNHSYESTCAEMNQLTICSRVVKNKRCTLRGKLISPNSISAFEPEHTGFKTE